MIATHSPYEILAIIVLGKQLFTPVHIPVLVDPILGIAKEQFSSDSKLEILDCTLGEGGHSSFFLEQFPNATILGVDQDLVMLSRAKERLNISDRISYLHSNFANLDLDQKFDLAIVDLGISNFHYVGAERGFSYKSVEPLDMRLNPQETEITAEEILNVYPKKNLETIFYEYGEERWTKKIVERILETRKKRAITTTQDLAKLVESVIPRPFWPPHAHPSIRVFQALRIEVNDELEVLRKAIPKIFSFLKDRGILQIISFHSLEDRIVKHSFKSLENSLILTKKPVMATDSEIQTNPQSRTAKLRAIQKRVDI